MRLSVTPQPPIELLPMRAAGCPFEGAFNYRRDRSHLHPPVSSRIFVDEHAHAWLALDVVDPDRALAADHVQLARVPGEPQRDHVWPAVGPHARQFQQVRLGQEVIQLG